MVGKHGEYEYDYPIELGLAYLLLVGYVARVLCRCCRLPGSVGVFVSGFVYSWFMERDLLSARNQLQELAFFFVLLNAGFEISLKDVRAHVMVIASLPAAFELLGITLYGVLVQHYSIVESLVLATVLFCPGEGLVVPKMEELSKQFPGHPMPRLVTTWVALEATFGLTFFGILTGVSDPANKPHVHMGMLMFGSSLQVFATIVGGAIFGSASGFLISRRESLKMMGRQVFTGATVEAFLLILGVALIVYSLGDADIIPLGVVEGDSLFQPELFVIVTGSFFAHTADAEVLREVGGTVSGVWVFGSIVLFSLLGSRTDVKDMGKVFQVLPIIFVGVSLRFIGICIASWLTLRRRHCSCSKCTQANKASFIPDAVFCFLCSLPRATMQGALGSLPVQQRFFQYDPSRKQVQTFVAAAARIYIVCFSIGGSILLELCGPYLLRIASQRREVYVGRCENTARTPVLDLSQTPSVAAEHGRPADAREVMLVGFREHHLEVQDPTEDGQASAWRSSSSRRPSPWASWACRSSSRNGRSGGKASRVSESDAQTVLVTDGHGFSTSSEARGSATTSRGSSSLLGAFARRCRLSSAGDSGLKPPLAEEDEME